MVSYYKTNYHHTTKITIANISIYYLQTKHIFTCNFQVDPIYYKQSFSSIKKTSSLHLYSIKTSYTIMNIHTIRSSATNRFLFILFFPHFKIFYLHYTGFVFLWNFSGYTLFIFKSECIMILDFECTNQYYMLQYFSICKFSFEISRSVLNP